MFARVLLCRPAQFFPGFPHGTTLQVADLHRPRYMYSKLFSQIFDSSIANNYELRHFFMDLIVLADPKGVVDMTPEAISSRTRIPLEIVVSHLFELEKPDTRSRNPVLHGRRIVKLDDHRDWGWRIVNFVEYHRIASEEQRRMAGKMRVRKWRENKKMQDGNAPVTPCYAGNGTQTDTQTQTYTDSTPISPSAFDVFWNAYPKKKGKDKAVGVFDRKGCVAILDVILSAIAAQKRTDQWTKEGGQFIPYPASWLNSGGWKDETKVEVSRPYTGSNI